MRMIALPMLLTLIFPSRESLAYGCSRPENVGEALEGRSPLVFTGTVSDIEVWSKSMTAVEFNVETLNRGDVGAKVVVLFGLDGRVTNWKVGERYAISAGTTDLSGSPNRSPRLFKPGKNYLNYVCDLVVRA